MLFYLFILFIYFIFFIFVGYVSWRNSQKGSWFIRCLVYILARFSHSYDLEKMMTKVKFMDFYSSQSQQECVFCLPGSRDNFLKTEKMIIFRFAFQFGFLRNIQSEHH